MSDPDRKEFPTTPREIKEGLWMTRNDHIKIHSSPPIDPKFGDNVCKGDTLSDQELKDYYIEELGGIRSLLAMPEEKIKIVKRGTHFLDPRYLSSELDYYRKRGIDIADGETLLEELKQLE